MNSSQSQQGPRKRRWSSIGAASEDDHFTHPKIQDTIVVLMREAEVRGLLVNTFKDVLRPILQSDPEKFSTLAPRIDAMLNRVRQLLQASDVNQEDFDAATWWIGFRLKHALELSSGSVDEASYRLQVYPDKPPDYLLLPNYLIPRANRITPPVAADDPGPEAVASWMDPFLCNINDHAPANFQRERLLWDLRRLRIPTLSEYAVLWPLHVEKYWAQLKPKVLDLLESSRPYRLSHWFMEWLFRSDWWTSELHSTKAGAAARTMHSIAAGTINSLEVAAMLGLWPSCLPYLIQDYASKLSEREQRACIIRALIYSFQGFDLLDTRTPGFSGHEDVEKQWVPPSCLQPSTYKGLDKTVGEARLQTIRYLCQQVRWLADVTILWNFVQPCYITSFAFLAAITFNDPLVLELVLQRGAEFDMTLIYAIRYTHKLRHTVPEDALQHALLIILDHALVAYLEKSEGRSLMETIRAIDDAFSGVLLTSGIQRQWPIRNMTLDDVAELAVDAIREGHLIHLQRALLDPRLSLSHIGPGSTDSTTQYLHMAVESDSLEAISYLIRSGASVTGIDSEGRTPLLCVESDLALALLVELGASTRDKDRQGRNIWHLAAASNDVRLLDWLCLNDPHKSENLAALNEHGRTPLADALYMINELIKDFGFDPKRLVPAAARRLLHEGLDKTCLYSDVPLAGLAVEWGALDIIESLIALGVDFCSINNAGLAPLQHISLMTPPHIIRRLLELTDSMMIANTKNRGTPPVAIFMNTIRLRTVMEEEHSAPPTGDWEHHILNPEMYELLLRQEWLESTEKRGYCVWKGLWQMLAHICSNHLEPSQCDLFMREAYYVAINCQIKHNKHKAFELHQQIPAFHALLPSVFDGLNYSLYSLPLKALTLALDASSDSQIRPSHEQRLYYDLLHIYVEKGDLRRSWRLATLGAPFKSYQGFKDPDTGEPLEHEVSILDDLPLLYTDDRPMYYVLVEAAKPRDLSVIRRSLFTTIFESDDHQVQTLAIKRLLKAGMDVDVCKPTPLYHAVQYGNKEAAKLLIEHGADVVCASSSAGRSPFMNAAWHARYEILPLLIEAMPHGFLPWNLKRKCCEPRSCHVNIIQASALKYNGGQFLRILFANIKGYEQAINEPCENRSAAQIAAKQGHADTLRVLWEHGADLSVRYKGTPGWTILHGAYNGGQVEIVKLLAEIDPGASEVRDHLGVLPHEVEVKAEGTVPDW